ncbi:hypothetical protein SAMN05216196_10212 [Lutimaribacter pacificus]|uniref:Uncharacterized protein n=1 Tax=Lutimaribacter pacificus TaxID=391948 RepID=A0A1H0DXW2_9RHOB|nr:hypothetical protein [Lutimaribacter pacificus]SDN75107.1 hypothetical protein SAMN05216196_10212 [Lutimaribacter pacificus]SHK58664.1 hypothetical protein SAMN05444142_106276 [Lutimaribacter pacificus]
MFLSRSLTPERARELLAKQRQMVSLLDKEILARSDEIAFERENWVDAFIDYGHAVSFDNRQTMAYRGIATRDGTLFWLVRRQDKKHGYHAAATDPLEAVEEAQTAWARRKAVRQDWDRVEQMANALILGRLRFRVTIDDALASPLCTLGIECFLDRHRLRNTRNVSGRFAALLMKIEPQVGFVIHQAHLRTQQDSATDNTSERD